jgi:hypothetical protein
MQQQTRAKLAQLLLTHNASRANKNRTSPRAGNSAEDPPTYTHTHNTQQEQTYRQLTRQCAAATVQQSSAIVVREKLEIARGPRRPEQSLFVHARYLLT